MLESTGEAPLAGDAPVAVPRSFSTDRPASDLVATVAHELRGPLTLISGHLQVARRNLPSDPVRTLAAIDHALANVHRMAKLVIDLVESSSLASSELLLNVVTFDLAAAITDALARHEIGERPPVRFTPAEASAYVSGDPERIAQVLDNLLGNALKYGGSPGTVEVSLAVVDAEAHVRVTDHGIGISPDDCTQLFTPFFRASNARDIPGTGLGLCISRRLVERHGGRLSLESSSSAGSTFLLELPIVTGLS